MKLLHTTAENMKLAIMMQQRFLNGASMVVTECGKYSSDVLVIDRNDEMVEFETKISFTDFKADFKKPKHNIYEHVSKVTEWEKKFEFVPHRFYFVVPEALISEVLPKLMGKPYGVIAVPDIPFKPFANWIQANHYLRVVKRAGAIRKHHVTEHEKEIIIKRITSELINEKIKHTRKVLNENDSKEDEIS